MFEASQNPTGAGFTTVVGFLTLMFLPAALVVARPAGFFSIALATACGLLCMALARLTWERTAQLSIPSVEGEKATRL
jgi:hypothetical protein